MPLSSVGMGQAIADKQALRNGCGNDAQVVRKFFEVEKAKLVREILSVDRKVLRSPKNSSV